MTTKMTTETTTAMKSTMIKNTLLAGAALAGLLALAGHASAEFPGRDKAPTDLTPKMVKEQALKVDVFIANAIRKQGMDLIGDSTDEQFLRRVYLNIVGRIPSYDEAIEFLDSDHANKRTDLIDTLLESPGYNSHMFNYWADILRAKHKFGGNNRTNGISYLNYIKRSIAENRPYDDWVREMITASGGGWQRGSGGAVGYLERDKGMPLDNMANTMQVFTGTRMECAQCHNHPHNDEISQKDFFYMAAFTHGLEPPRKREYAGGDRMLYDRAPQDLRNFMQQLRYNVFDYGVKGGGDGVVPLPDDYQYRDADPGEMVGMKTMQGMGKSVRNARAKPIDDSREQFAKWLTAPDHQRFTKVIANRLWKKVMGRGLFEPVDNLDQEVVISHPALLVHLEKLLVNLDYDMKAYMRVLYNTRTFQFQPNPEEFDIGKPYHFAGRVLSRMTAEQIWDSMLATTVPDIDRRPGANYLPYMSYRGRYVLVGKKDMYDIYEEAMKLEGKELYDYAAGLLDTMKSDGGMRGDDMMAMGSAAMMGGGANAGAAGAKVDDKQWSGYSADLIRASELPSPTPPGHFLRKFGQSAREVIQGATTESDVTQILSLINGHVEKHIIGNSNALVNQGIEATATPEEKIEAAFVAILTRRPTEEETALFKTNLEAAGEGGYDDLVWTLYNTNEFMFVQ
ncbi:MAG: DUF1549 domain-containing protein [Verrucomicrobiales bacterium]